MKRMSVPKKSQNMKPVECSIKETGHVWERDPKLGIACSSAGSGTSRNHSSLFSTTTAGLLFISSTHAFAFPQKSYAAFGYSSNEESKNWPFEKKSLEV